MQEILRALAELICSFFFPQFQPPHGGCPTYKEFFIAVNIFTRNKNYELTRFRRRREFKKFVYIPATCNFNLNLNKNAACEKGKPCNEVYEVLLV